MQPASAAQESCDQCKYLRCLKSSVERKQNLIKVYEGLLNFWKTRSTDDNGNPVMVRDFGKLAEPDRTRIYNAVAHQLEEYGLMEKSRTAAVPAAEGCGYPDTELSANTNSFLCITEGVAELQKQQPCKEIAALIATHEAMHVKECRKRQQPNRAYWRRVYTNADGTQGEIVLPPKIQTPVGRAAEEIAAYQIEIAGLKPIIEKLEKRCKYRANGKTGDAVYSGVICSLEKPFTVTATIPIITYPFKFVPSSATAGTVSFNAAIPMLTVEGSGSYKIERADTDKPRIAMTASSTGHTPKFSESGGSTVYIDLVPLDTDECS